MPTARLPLYGGIAGPVAFVAAWAVGSAVKEGYSPVSRTISRLAEPGASTRPLMTAGFVAFGLCMLPYARAVGRVLDSPATGAAVAASALGSLGVAAWPVTADGGTRGDKLHYYAAATAYAANALAPLLAARRFDCRRGRRGSAAIGAAVATALVASVRHEPLTGLLQRTGLTLYDTWSVLLAVRLLQGPVAAAG
jgi:hypothetical membrane protein